MQATQANGASPVAGSDIIDMKNTDKLFDVKTIDNTSTIYLSSGCVIIFFSFIASI